MIRKSLAACALGLLMVSSASADDHKKQIEEIQGQLKSLSATVNKLNETISKSQGALKKGEPEKKPDASAKKPDAVKKSDCKEPTLDQLDIDLTKIFAEKLKERQEAERKRLEKERKEKRDREAGCILKELLDKAKDCDKNKPECPKTTAASYRISNFGPCDPDPRLCYTFGN